uniref:NADH-ubiquinone oxidoreductase chain 2 n=1 Tax=Carpelimus bilineatus TaxID=346749 RepID=A0A0S2M6W2_9COLE|nr:NADH deshydrogenase subunit 2 [Carpelimus bilineatus]
MFFNMLMFSIILSISSYSWYSIWLGLEINLMMMIPLMNNSKNIMNTESSIKYFSSQVIASTMLLFSIIMMSNNLINYYSLILLLNSALLMKLGSAPFHFWFPEVMEGQKWNICLIILTLQKIIPFMILNYNMNLPMFFSSIIFMNMMISMFLGMNQISIRKIITYSSINHIGWMISIMIFSKMTWMLYFIIYFMTMMIFAMTMNLYNIYSMNQLIKINLNMNFKLIIMFMFFSMAGLPPFIGFMPKWMTIQLMIYNNNYLLPSVMVIITLFTMFYYIRLMMSSLMFSSFNEKNFKPYFLMNLNLLLLCLLPLMMLMM